MDNRIQIVAIVLSAMLLAVVFGLLVGVTPGIGGKLSIEPKVPIRSSIKPDYIVCLEDGKRLKMLKRHLMTHYQMTPDQYRQKWGLNADYPMVAPNYAKARSELANKCNRLGKIVDKELNVFHIETAINNRMYGSDMDFLLKNEDDFTAFDRMKFEAMRYTMSKMPRPARRKLLHSRPAQYEMIACHAGKTELVHEKIHLDPGALRQAIDGERGDEQNRGQGRGEFPVQLLAHLLRGGDVGVGDGNECAHALSS